MSNEAHIEEAAEHASRKEEGGFVQTETHSRWAEMAKGMMMMHSLVGVERSFLVSGNGIV